MKKERIMQALPEKNRYLFEVLDCLGQTFFITIALQIPHKCLCSFNDLFDSFSNRMIVVESFATVVFLFLFQSKRISSNRFGKKQRILISIVLSAVTVFGYNMKIHDSISCPAYNCWGGILFLTVCLLGYFLFYFYVSSYAFHLLLSASTKEQKTVTDKSYITLKCFALLLAVWSVYYLLLWPGIATYDSYNQISQAIGWIPLQNNNPFIHTLLMRIIIKPVYMATGNIDISIAVYSFFSLLVFSLVSARIVSHLYNILPQKWIITFVVLYYLLNPLVGYYNVTLWKDIWISWFSAYLLTILLDLSHNQKKTLASDRILLFELIISILGTLAFKGTGIIIVTVAFLSVFVVLKNQRVCISCVFLSCILLFYLTTFVAINTFNVTPHSSVDTRSIIWQTLARTVRDHKENLTEDEKKVLEIIVEDIDSFGNAYTSTTSDPVKVLINEESYKNSELKVIKLWVKLLLKYPKSYINAIFTMGYGYVFPEVDHWCFSPAHYEYTVKEFAKSNIIHDPNYLKYDINTIDNRHESLLKIRAFFENLKNIPVISLFLSPGFYFQALFVLLGFSLAQKKDVLFFLVPFSILISCQLSPVFAEMRYAYPAVQMVPPFAMWAISSSDKKTETKYQCI